MGGNVERNINISIVAPAYEADRRAIPKTKAIPTLRSPSMKRKSTIGFPARLWKKSAKGPYVAFFKYPNVGEKPSIQALSGGVAKPNPNNLSKNAQRKINPIPIRKKPKYVLTTY